MSFALKPSNRTLGEFIPTPRPDRAEMPPRADVAAQLRNYQGRAAVAQGELFDPSPENIEQRVQRSQVGACGSRCCPRRRAERG
jgi:zinc protease